MVQIIKLLEVLTQAKVDFVLVGGAAAAAYGSTMVTQDLDVCGDISSENLCRLATAMAPFNPCHRMDPNRSPFSVEDRKPQTFKNVYLQTDLGQLDFLGSIKGVGDYSEVYAASQPLLLGNFSINILSLSTLIASKEAMGRPRDLENASILKALENERN